MSVGRILVTGATGRLGRTVLAALGERGVAGVRRRGSDTDAILLTADGTVDPVALRGIDAIINCAGRVDGSADEIGQANVAFPSALARTARSVGVARIVQVSSFSVFGRTEHIDRDTPIAPADVYGRSKVAAERALRALDTPGFRTVPLRLPFMFSADHPAHLGRLVTTMLRLRVLPTQVGKPGRRSMMTYAGAADALIALAESPDPPDRPVAAADPRPLALVTVARAIETRLHKEIAVLPVPGAIVAAAGVVAPGMINRLFRSSVLDTSANLVTASAPHDVELELDRYLDRLAQGRSAGHDRVT